MPMTRARKEEEIKALNARFNDNRTVIVTLNKGLDMPAMTALRSELKANGASFKITKNTLARRAIKGTQFEALEGKFEGPTGIATSQDPVAAAKVVYEFAKENDRLEIIGGALGSQVLDVSEVENLAKLPSLDELRSKIVGLLQAPATKVAGVLQAPAGKLARVAAAYGESGQ